MQLRDLSTEDLWLYEAIHCDPAMMSELGGPLPREGLADKLRKDVADVAADVCWILVIVPDEGPATAAGTVAVWSHDVDGESVDEIGWMVLSRFQGRGLGSEAVRAVLRRARSERRWNVLHAFPPVTNARSNAMCRRMGFTQLEERDFAFRDRTLRCNHWRIDLRAGPA
jgi:RimJ/RimL family protein N-acetyltransferase